MTVKEFYESDLYEYMDTDMRNKMISLVDDTLNLMEDL